MKKKLFRALYLDEREALFEPLSFFRGRKKNKAWKSLFGFRENPSNFRTRLKFANKNRFSFQTVLGKKLPSPLSTADQDWLICSLELNSSFDAKSDFKIRFPSIEEYVERGLINPFLPLVIDAALNLSRDTSASDESINVMLASQLGSIEQLTRRAVILDLHVDSTLKGTDEDSRQKFLSFVSSFEEPLARLRFFETYPVLLRSVKVKLNNWVRVSAQFLKRLDVDRALIEEKFIISKNVSLIDVICAGDTHNDGHSVLVLKFSSNDQLIYKPRSVKLEKGYQDYLAWANERMPGVDLRLMKILDRTDYGWVEFIENYSIQKEELIEKYYYRLGVLTALVYSINGVDIFFENLIAAGDQPVIIDLETMFHDSLEDNKPGGPKTTLQNWLFRSVAGIGILPQPGVGSSDSDVFDVSVMGARTNAEAPYKVTGIENFGNSDMRITEISGWIPDAKSSLKNDISRSSKGFHVFKGLNVGFDFLLEYKDQLSGNDGMIYRWFAAADRRLIVRDTKIYGTLQQDENHPDLLRDQLDREWHWDNLWADVVDRPFLEHFVKSELGQLRQGDIPYFCGSIGSTCVTGGDGCVIDLQSLIELTPIDLVSEKLQKLSELDVAEQVRVAATQLGLSNFPGVTQPIFSKKMSCVDAAITVAEFIDHRIKAIGCRNWCDNSLNPVPKSEEDPVTTVPIDPFLYDGLCGVAMYFCDVGEVTGDRYWTGRSIEIYAGILEELSGDDHYSSSGFVGIASVIYAINRCISVSATFGQFENQLVRLTRRVEKGIESETVMDVLLGLAGTGLAVLPFAERKRDPRLRTLLAKIYFKLINWIESNLEINEPASGIEFIRGFSHGFSGIALAVYRLGDFLGEADSLDITKRLLVKESRLVSDGGWTDRHQYQGKELVGWCHGSSGIALVLSELSQRVQLEKPLLDYYAAAKENTLKNGFYDSHCICHGSVGNLMCLKACGFDHIRGKDLSDRLMLEILNEGFSSFGRAQTMGIGLMTGLIGSGYLFLSESDSEIDLKFLTLK